MPPVLRARPSSRSRASVPRARSSSPPSVPRRLTRCPTTPPGERLPMAGGHHDSRRGDLAVGILRGGPARPGRRSRDRHEPRPTSSCARRRRGARARSWPLDHHLECYNDFGGPNLYSGGPSRRGLRTPAPRGLLASPTGRAPCRERRPTRRPRHARLARLLRRTADSRVGGFRGLAELGAAVRGVGRGRGHGLDYGERGPRGASRPRSTTTRS